MLKRLCSMMAVALLVQATAAQAELARVGPTSAATGGFPAWYQDQAGLALDLCLPSQAELNAGTCLLLPGDANPGAPYAVPSNFPEEAFWWAGNSLITTNGGGKASLVMALEAAFANGAPAVGDQIAFTRIRLVIDVPEPGGTYIITHPFGTEVFPDLQPGVRSIFFTEDIGAACAGDFSCAMRGRTGPFLRPSATAGGAPLPFATGLVPGQTYIADPNVETPITGSPFGTNIFRIEGPNIGGPGINVAETDLFTLMGRVHTAAIASPLAVDRATYTRDATSGHVDVFATASAGIGATAPTLSVTGVDMIGRMMTEDPAHPGKYVAQGLPIVAGGAVPASVKVSNTADNPRTVVEANVVDEVTITEAKYDGTTKRLSVKAVSSDAVAPPTLVLENPPATLVGGAVVVSVEVSPVNVRVLSSAGGYANLPVSQAEVPYNGPVAIDDVASTPGDTAVDINVSANDVGAGTVAILGNPLHGTAAIGATAGTFTYTPTVGYNGPDEFTYTLTNPASGLASVGTVRITVAFSNHAPTAVADSSTVALGQSTTIDVLANDTDPDGTTSPIDPATLAIASQPASGTVTLNAGKIVYTPGANTPLGNQTFTYTVADTTGAVSNAGTVTVNVFGSEVITVAKSQYVISKARWDVSGTTTVFPNNTMTIKNGSTGEVIGTAVVDNLGNWALQIVSSPVKPDASQTVTITSSKGGSRTVAVTIKN